MGVESTSKLRLPASAISPEWSSHEVTRPSLATPNAIEARWTPESGLVIMPHSWIAIQVIFAIRDDRAKIESPRDLEPHRRKRNNGNSVFETSLG